MKLTIGCSLFLVMFLVMVQMSGSDASSDHHLSRPKRGFFDNLIDELVTSFSKSFSKIFKLNPDDFETFLRSLGRISKTVAKNIIEKFHELQDKNFDFGTKENFKRVTAVMDTLQEVDQRQETNGATILMWPSTLCLPLLAKLVNLL